MGRVHAEHDAWLSRVGPYAKIVTLAFVMVAAIFAEPLVVAALTVALLPLARWGGVRGLPRGLTALLPLAVMNAIVLGALLPGETLFELGFFRWTREGLHASVVVTLRLALALISSIGFSAVTSTREILSMIGRSPRAGLALSAAIRSVPEAARDVSDARDARALRVGAPRTGIGALRSSIPALVPAFVRAVRRGENMGAALRVAGFDGRRRTAYVKVRWTSRDPVLFGVAATVAVLTFFI